MAEPKVRGRGGLPVADDVVEVETPQAETTTTQADHVKAAAEARRQQISAARDKPPKAEAKPAFVPNKARIDELLTILDEQGADTLVKMAVDQNLLRKVDAEDTRVFQYTGSTTDALRGQDVSRSKIRSNVVEFLKTREGEYKAATVGGKLYEHAAEGRVIHAFMFLAGESVHGGKYDSGYVATRRGENKQRGMVARGYLRSVGDADSTTAAPEAPTVEAEAE